MVNVANNKEQAEDNAYNEARDKMVRTQIVATGVQRKSLIDCFQKIEREKFVPEEFKLISYSAKEIPLPEKRFLLNPMDLGLLLDRVDFDEISNVLVIGDGTGYATQILACLTDNIVSLDSVKNFQASLQKNLLPEDLKKVKIIEADVKQGAPEFGKYDLIFINGAVQTIPDALFDQLSPEGKILTALKKPFISHAVYQYKIEGVTQTERLFECAVSLLPDFGKKSKFVF